MKTITMTFEEWEKEFKIVDTDEFCMTAPRRANPLTIWTKCDADGVQSIFNGVRIFNRVSYIITEKEYDPNFEYKITIDE
jgi:hypothetical protein